MQRLSVMILMTALLLTACGQQEDSAAPLQQNPVQEQNAVVQQEERAERIELEMNVEGEIDRVPAALYGGQGYSIYIPEDGWQLEEDIEEQKTTWESTINGDVELEVRCYPGLTAAEARDRFVSNKDDFVFEQWQDSQAGENVEGIDQQDNERLVFFAVEGKEESYIISWQHPNYSEMIEGFGARMEQMAKTFMLTV